MRKVTRGAEPASLKKNGKSWTRALLAEISQKGDYAKVGAEYKNKYNQPDIKDALSDMYNNHCCYCEGLLGIQTYGQIEHLKPKSLPKFYALTYDWNNLHWSCEICNVSYKRTRWDDKAPILDPTVDDIPRYLELDLNTGEYLPVLNNDRAKTTIEHTGMNRESLIKARRQLIVRMVKNYKVHRKCGKGDIFLEEMLLECEENSYPSVVKDVCKEIDAL